MPPSWWHFLYTKIKAMRMQPTAASALPFLNSFMKAKCPINYQAAIRVLDWLFCASNTRSRKKRIFKKRPLFYLYSLWITRLNISDINMVFFCPILNPSAYILWPIIASNGLRFASPFNNPIKGPDYSFRW